MLQGILWQRRARAASPAARALFRRPISCVALAAALLASLPASGEEQRVAEISFVGDIASVAGVAARPGPAPTLMFAEGDAVDLRWTSDRELVLHLHGYDLEARVGPRRPATMAFVARAAGRFPVETHAADGRHRAVLYVEIHPK